MAQAPTIHVEVKLPEHTLKLANAVAAVLAVTSEWDAQELHHRELLDAEGHDPARFMLAGVLAAHSEAVLRAVEGAMA